LLCPRGALPVAAAAVCFCVRAGEGDAAGVVVRLIERNAKPAAAAKGCRPQVANRKGPPKGGP
jgi:hypothetical protein